MDSIKKFLSLIKGLWFAPFTIFLIGFIYVQGAFSPFLSDAVIFNQLIKVTPVSYNLYITNGILISVSITIALLVAHVLSKYISFSNRFKQFFRVGIHKQALFIIINMFILIIITLIQILLLSNLNLKINIPIIYTCIYALYFLSAFIYFRLDKEIYQVTSFYKEFNILYYSYSFFLVFSLIFSVYAHGLLAQNQIINDYKANKGGLHFITVTDVDDHKVTLLRYDINNEFIIGYDLSEGKMQIYPKDAVRKVETFTSKSLEAKDLFTPNHALVDEYSVVIDVIEKYYTYLMKPSRNSDDTIEFLNLLSTGLKSKYFNGITGSYSNILTEKMNNELYRNLETKNYYGVVYSVPELEAAKENDAPGISYRKVYVKEYWKGQTFDVLYTLKGLNNIWEITKVEDTSFSFNQ